MYSTAIFMLILHLIWPDMRDSLLSVIVTTPLPGHKRPMPVRLTSATPNQEKSDEDERRAKEEKRNANWPLDIAFSTYSTHPRTSSSSPRPCFGGWLGHGLSALSSPPFSIKRKFMVGHKLTCRYYIFFSHYDYNNEVLFIWFSGPSIRWKASR